MPIKTVELTCIHYGSKSFDPDKWVDPHDRELKHRLNKASGGLWASPMNSEYGWKEWCEAEDFRECKKKESFIFDYKGKTLVIDTVQDLDLLQWEKIHENLNLEFPVWKPIIDSGIDGVWLTEAGQIATRFGLDPTSWHNLYGWDCETLFVINPEAIKQRERTT